MTKCTYISSSGIQCQNDALNEGFCLWHDASSHKTDLKSQLMKRAKTGVPMDGFQLAYSDLSEIDLVNQGQKKGFQLTNSDLYRCNLKNAHLFGLDLAGSSLMKANLSGANLHCANLENCNLLGVRLEESKLEGIHWGKRIRQERDAQQAASHEEQLQLYSEAEEIYRYLGRIMRAQGMTEHVGIFFHREMVNRRRQLPKYSLRRILSKLSDIYCGYGERPLRLIVISMLVVLFFALFYSVIGLQYNGVIEKISSANSWQQNIGQFFSALYFSITTFTTLGYGDYSPVGISRVLASIEAFLGSFTLALFVVVFVRRLSR